MNTPLWQPDTRRAAETRLAQFMREAEAATGQTFADYTALHQWSVRDSDLFWQQVYHFCGLTAEGDTAPAMQPGVHLRETRWFPNLRLNYAQNLLRHADTHPHDIALVCETENGRQRRLSFDELRHAAGQFAARLKQAGVMPGDRVAGWLPNGPEAVIAALGSAWIGAVWSSCSPDFGVSGVLDRFGQIEPTVLLLTDGYHYNGKWIDLTERATQIRAGLPSATVVQIATGEQRLPDTQDWQAWLDGALDVPDYALLPFEHPLYILYSSGTTGQPKCIVHGAGGTLLQHAKEHALHGDLRQGDRLFYFTTCGWMMWNWLVGGLQAGATLVLYDGNPAWPDTGRLFDLAARERVTHFGTSAKFIQAVEKSGLVPREKCDLSALRVLFSTGSPLLHESFDFVYQAISEQVQLSSISGGTDIISCFALGNPLLPVYRGELQCLGLGMDVAVFNDAGEPVTDEKGELVCRAPFPSMPVGFWRDADGSRYHKAYFSRFENVWAHGDYAELRPHDGWQGMVIHGRSDAVLNPGGVRIGTAEIYRQVESLADIRESIVVGQEWDGDVRVVLFVVPQPGVTLDDTLRARLRKAIREGASPRHVPAVILAVPEIPRTVSGKIVELAVREIIHGRPVTNLNALANPAALAHFRDREELR